MATATKEREYELVLMLDPELPEEGREKLAADARGRIEAAGELRHDEPWGLRKMAYDINRRTEADYRFYRFRGERSLLDDLDHNLKIADGVLRFRIFKVDPDAPLTKPPEPSAIAPRGRREGRGDRRGGPPREAEPEAPSPEAEPAPEAQEPSAEAEPASEAEEPLAEAEPAPEPQGNEAEATPETEGAEPSGEEAPE